ncbi:acyl-CoA reductase [Antarcticibacterium arcticum]|uniref:Acyl-CoA reductase n=1 Tax=Antarcticibacterium arcticum TaxID=2585771 RepID=A0A5B8YGH7_9FLAO|nr:acyl-CoA reductase [Antarcticibacterium arcticum]QED37092.1 acyl-CoA reductase [Antarcticibacterium arcticum]
MTIQQRKDHLVMVGKFLGQFKDSGIVKDASIPNNDEFFLRFEEEIDRAIHYNGWFTRENVLFAVEEWSKALTEENLESWTSPYNFTRDNVKTVGIVMAGNIPMVGFHDFISVLLSGHRVLVKQSSNDQRLLPVIADYLKSLDSGYEEFISFTEGRMLNFDAVIATGSNNTSRYFEYYFAKKPSIIRKNRNSVAILTGKETNEQLQALGMDIFRYFGLGCRNVSKLYVPHGYNFDQFYKAIEPWSKLLDHAKYANNYDYNKAVYLMSEFKFLDNGFLILRESTDFGSPIATLFYETYRSKEELNTILANKKDDLQCIVSHNFISEEIPYGKTQYPQLWDYADKVDTLDFLQKL